MPPVAPGEQRRAEFEFIDFVDPVTGNSQRVLHISVQGVAIKVGVNLDLPAVHVDAPPAVAVSRGDSSSAVPDNPPSWVVR
jgi:hypothetical protein